MSNLTITTDDEVLKRARMRALAEGTSVNAVLRDFLAVYAGVKQDQLQALERILKISSDTTARRGKQQWNRDSLHDR
jgi:plasmid stability protein